MQNIKEKEHMPVHKSKVVVEKKQEHELLLINVGVI